jgi:hypothetical protein
LALLGIGAQIVLPTEKWIGYGLIGLALYGFIIFGFKRERRPLNTIGIIPILWIVLGSLFFVGGAIGVWHGCNLAWPLAKTKPALEQPTFREKAEEAFLELGPVLSKIDILQEGKRNPVYFGEYAPATIYIEDGKLYADVTIWGGIKKPSIEIVHNDFTIRPLNWDKNSNNDALEIVDENHKPVFQMIYKTKTHLAIYGIFPNPNGWVTGVNEKSLIPNLPSPENFPIKRIFKYPSWKFPGQFEEGG